MVKAITHDLPKLRIGGGIHHLMCPDRAAGIDHNRPPRELLGDRPLHVVDRQVVTVTNHRHNLVLAMVRDD